jgi:hypothetical protein
MFFINANHSEFNQTVGNNLGRAVKKVNILIIINYAEMQVNDTLFASEIYLSSQENNVYVMS